MFRTKDFILLLTTIVFLVVAIASTVMSQITTSENEVTAQIEVTNSIGEYSAELYNKESIDRDENINSLRQKISIAEDTAPIEISTPPIIPEESDADLLTYQPILCPDHQQYRGQWPFLGVESQVQEGARLFYIDTVSVTNASGTVIDTKIKPILQLPMSPLPTQAPTCLSQDVIGVATDGSLIRNSEVSLYGIFGPDTVVGYALDGNPIYGQGVTEGDICGGEVTSTGYRYIISPNDQNILNCFVSRPVTI